MSNLDPYPICKRLFDRVCTTLQRLDAPALDRTRLCELLDRLAAINREALAPMKHWRLQLQTYRQSFAHVCAREYVQTYDKALLDHRRSEYFLWRQVAVLGQHRQRLEETMEGFAAEPTSRGFYLGVEQTMQDVIKKRGSSEPKGFMAEALHKYDKALRPEHTSEPKSRWCLISGPCFWDSEIATIIPAQFGASNMAYLFGESDSRASYMLWSPENTLLLNERVKRQAWDKRRLIILPDPNGGAEFISYILDEDLLERNDFLPESATVRWQDLHKRRLHFNTDARPSKRYLIAHMCLVVIWRQFFRSHGDQKRPTNWKADVDKIKAWTKGPVEYRVLCRSFVRAISRIMSGSPREWLNAFSTDSIRDQGEEKTIDMAADACCSLALQTVFYGDGTYDELFIQG